MSVTLKTINFDKLCQRLYTGRTKSCHTKFPMKCDESLVFVVAEVVSNQFKARKKILVFSVNNGKNYFIRVF